MKTDAWRLPNSSFHLLLGVLLTLTVPDASGDGIIASTENTAWAEAADPALEPDAGARASGQERTATCGELQIPYREFSPVIDGMLDDWPGASAVSFFDHEVPAHDRNDIAVFLGWDDIALYAALRVDDGYLSAVPQEHLPSFGWKEAPPHLALPGDSLQLLYLNDSVELFVTARHEPADRFRHGDYEFVVDVVGRSLAWEGSELLAAADESLIAPKIIARSLVFEAVAQHSGTINYNDDRDEGFVAELKIPWAAIGIPRAESGLRLRMLAANNDNDRALPPDYLPLFDGSPHAPQQRYYSLDWCGGRDYLPSNTWAMAALADGPSRISRVLGESSFARVLVHIVVVAVVIGLGVAVFVRNTMRRRRKALVVPHDDEALLSADEAFLQCVQRAVESHLSDDSLTVDQLSYEVGLSSRQLQRRLKELTGQTPTAFLRSYRLHKGARLLERQVGTVSEIAYLVGFKNASHFSRAFRDEFGRSPSEYRQQHADVDGNT